MNSAEFHGSKPINPPEDWEQDDTRCVPLHVEYGEHAYPGLPTIKSIWVPSPDERALIAAGGNIVLFLVGKKHPPIAVMVTQERVLDENPFAEWEQ